MKSRTRIKTVGTLITLVVLFGVIVPVALAWPFSDVPVGYWAYDQIHRVANMNITTGCGGGKYCPLSPVNRDQMAVFMDNLSKAHTNQPEPYLFRLDHQYTSGENPALIARSYAGPGVEGISYGGTEADNGVYGETNSTDEGKAGVYGGSSSYASGVAGWSDYGTGVYGHGVYGVVGWSDGNYGVLGQTGASGWVGVAGTAPGGPAGPSFLAGVWGSGSCGVLGQSSSSSGTGIRGETSNEYGYCGTFYTSVGHGVAIYTPIGKAGLYVSGGTKSAAVDTDQGQRLLYTEESSEVWFTDYGFGQLQDGAVTIAIDPLFAQTVNLDQPYHVFVQVRGDAEVYVTNLTATSFDIVLREGDPNVEFSYRLVAKRLGYEDTRLEAAPPPPELQAQEGQ